MPEWSEHAIILSSRPHGENNAVVSLFTPSKGRHAGLVYAASGKSKRGTIEAGIMFRQAGGLGWTSSWAYSR